MSARLDMRKVLRAAQRAGLTLEYGGRHAKLVDRRSGRSIPVSCTPSDLHSYKAVLRDARRFLGITIR